MAVLSAFLSVQIKHAFYFSLLFLFCSLPFLLCFSSLSCTSKPELLLLGGDVEQGVSGVGREAGLFSSSLSNAFFQKSSEQHSMAQGLKGLEFEDFPVLLPPYCEVLTIS